MEPTSSDDEGSRLCLSIFLTFSLCLEPVDSESKEKLEKFEVVR